MINSKTIIFLPGFASSANLDKAQYLTQRFEERVEVRFHAFEFTPTPKDFEFLTFTGMISRLRQYILDQQLNDVSLIATSKSALVALHYAHQYGGINRLLLLAPHLTYRPGELAEAMDPTWREQGVADFYHFGFAQALPLRYQIEQDAHFYRTPPPPPVPVAIIQGLNDEPWSVVRIRAYAARYEAMVHLREIESAGHNINDQLDDVWPEIEAFLFD
jgi:pimeloyl-ACP methyl ester carboxylesterase